MEETSASAAKKALAKSSLMSIDAGAAKGISRAGAPTAVAVSCLSISPLDVARICRCSSSYELTAGTDTEEPFAVGVIVPEPRWSEIAGI